MSIKHIVTVLFLMLTMSMSAKTVCVPKVYVFGFSSSFNDSIVYFSEVQELDSVWFNDKNNFMECRPQYSDQLKSFLESRGEKDRTCTIFYSLKRNNIDATYKKVTGKYLQSGKKKQDNFIVKILTKEDFVFKTVVPDVIEDEKAERKDAQKARKEEKEQKKSEKKATRKSDKK